MLTLYNQIKHKSMSNSAFLEFPKLPVLLYAVLVLILASLSSQYQIFIQKANVQLKVNPLQSYSEISALKLNTPQNTEAEIQISEALSQRRIPVQEQNKWGDQDRNENFLGSSRIMAKEKLDLMERLRGFELKEFQLEKPFHFLKNSELKQKICKDYFSYDRFTKIRRFVSLNSLGKNSDLALEEKQYYESRYNISKYPQLPFCIVVPTFNNAAQERYLKNINSILQQDYKNYHVAIIDDGSTDGTGILINKFLQDYRISEQKIQLIINPNRGMALPNIYKAAHLYCKPYEIMVIVDGDDELMGKQVFKHFNMMYQHEDIWIAYTNFLSSTMIKNQELSVGYSKSYSFDIIQKNSYRNEKFLISHLRSFVTKLLTMVNGEDLQDENGRWFRAANDVAIYLPILEMSHKRVLYCPELSYIYNSETGLNNHLVKAQQQKRNQLKIKLKRSYNKLDYLLSSEEITDLWKSINSNIEIVDRTLSQPDIEPPKMAWQI